MNAEAKRHAAKMRLRNTERSRKSTWYRIAQLLRFGKITEAEAAEMRTQFWEDRRRDQIAAKL